MMIEDLENMFWQEFTVPTLEGHPHNEGERFWELLEAELPDLAARATAFWLEQKEDRIKTENMRSKYQTLCNSVFRRHLEEAIIQPLVTAFDIIDFEYSTDPSSRYQSLFFGYGEQSYDTRRMSVLEWIPLWRSDELSDYLDNLCLDLGPHTESAQTIQDWKATFFSLRHRLPQVPPNYAEDVFGIYKKVVLYNSYYFSTFVCFECTLYFNERLERTLKEKHYLS